MERNIKTANFVNEKAFENQLKEAEMISENLGKKISQSKEEIKRKTKIRNLVVTVGGIALIASATIFGITKVNAYNNRPIKIITKEAEIHAGHGYAPDGSLINPNEGHDCKIEAFTENQSVEKRLADYAFKNGYTKERVYEIIKEYKKLYNDEINVIQFEDEMEKIEQESKNGISK